MAYHRSGLLAESEQLSRNVLQANPRHVDSPHLLGVTRYQRGGYAAAVRQIDRAIQRSSRALDEFLARQRTTNIRCGLFPSCAWSALR